MKVYTNIFILCLIICSACTKKAETSLPPQAETDWYRQDSIALQEQLRTLSYYQTQLENLYPKVDSLLALFNYERQEKYQDKGYYGFAYQQSSLNPKRNYLQTLVRDDGQALVRCIYYGAHKINFQQISLAVGEMETVLCGHTHAFEADGWHQFLTLEDSAATHAIRFVDAHIRERIKVTYEGDEKNQCAFYLTDKDKKAMSQAYHLFVVTTDIAELEKRIRQTSLQIEKYQKRLQKQ